MNARSLINIDRFFYLPYLLLRFFYSFGAASGHRKPGAVIVIKFMGMGSITRFATLCDESNINREGIILLTFDKQKEICQLLGFKNAWFIRTSGPLTFLSDCVSIILKSWRAKPSHIIDYERCSYTVGLFRFLLGMRTQSQLLCFEDFSSRNTRGRLRSFSIEGLNLVSMFKLGVDTMPKTTTVLVEHEVEIQSEKILVNCNASNYLLARRYPKNDFVKLIKKLNDSYPGLHFCFTGSESELEYVETIVKDLTSNDIHAENVAGRWTLEQLCDELSVCRLFITCDSGPLHLAALLQVPTVAIWGPTQYEQFDYQHFKHIYNCSLHLPCAPCLTHPHARIAEACDGKITCMKDLTAETVCGHVQRAMGNEATRKIKVLPGMIAKKDMTLQDQPV